MLHDPHLLACFTTPNTGVELMSFTKGYISQKQKNLSQVIVAGVLVILYLSACNSATAVPSDASSPDLTVWRKVRSPLFPSNWAPTAETVWVRYTFAYGS